MTEASEYSGLPITLEGEARRPATPSSMAAASGQPDRIPSIEAPSALYRQLALQAPSRRRSARIAQMNWTGPRRNLTSRRSKRPFYFWLNEKYFISQSAWACHLDFTFGNILTDGSSRMTKLSV
jgi:hypothetical protein